MTSLNTTSGWNAKKQKGSNLTTRRINQGSGAVGGATGEQRRHLSSVEEETGKRSTSGGGGGAVGRVVRATPATSVTVTSSVGSTTSTSTSRGVLRGAVSEVSSLSPPLSEEEVMRERELFYKEKYDYMTGVRIASTLGGFFLLVLLTLLYKSKCKGKHSREPSTLTLNSIPYPAPAIHPAHLTLMRGQNIQVNGGGRSHHYHDFGGGGASPGGGGGYPPTMTLLDSSGYGYMNQVHPANSHQPSVFSSNNCYTSTRSAGTHMKNPAVLLITAANSESSDEELSELISPDGGGAFLGEVVDIQPPPKHVEVERRRNRSGLGGAGSGPPGRQWSKSPPTILLGPGGGGGGPRGNIDINVILPTPSISPSGSENFNVGGGAGGHGQYFGGGGGASTLFPSIRPSGGGGGGAPPSGRGRLLVSRSLSSENENDQSEEVSVGGDGGDGGDQLSECSSNISNEGVGSANAPVPFGCGASSLFSLDNLKYVDDTSSENIPTRGDSEEGDDKEEDTRSIGSDSVFACFEHNFDHVAPTYARRVSSVSGASLQSPYPGSSPLPPPRHHHHHWNHSHHHRYHQHHHHHHSSIHPPPPPPPQPPHPSIPTIQQPEDTDTTTLTTGPDFQVTLTQAQAQVHHHHHQHRASSASFCSADLESINDYLETGGGGGSGGNGRRRSSSTQTTLSDLRQALGYSHIALGGDFNGGGGATSPGTISLCSATTSADPHRPTARRLSVPRRRRSLSPHLNPASPFAHLALSPRNSTSASTSTSPPQPPTSLAIHHVVPTTANASTTAQPEDFEEEDNPDNSNAEAAEESKMQTTPVTPTNPPPPPTVLVSPSSPFIPPRGMRKRSFDAVRKQLSLQCGSIDIDAGDGKQEQTSLYQVSSSNETTPTN